LNAPVAFGEEWGWRGYLLEKLVSFGQVKGLLLSGVIWGVWHAPIIMLGYNYPLYPRAGVFFMVITCVLIGVVLGWMRLATRSIWPAVIAHGALNGSAGVVFLLARAGSTVDTAKVGLSGWTGWVLLLVVIGILIAQKRLPVRASVAR